LGPGFFHPNVDLCRYQLANQTTLVQNRIRKKENIMTITFNKPQKFGASSGAPESFQDITDGGDIFLACINAKYDGEGVLASTSGHARWFIEKYEVTIYNKDQTSKDHATTVFMVADYKSARAANSAAKQFVRDNV
jgi:hypothetical protein